MERLLPGQYMESVLLPFSPTSRRPGEEGTFAMKKTLLIFDKEDAR